MSVDEFFYIAKQLRSSYNSSVDQALIKYHLGCGTKYLEGFLNVDFAPSQHTTVDGKLNADLYADILTLKYLPASVIESHHVFEHFNYVDSFILLIKWTRSLVIGGMLHLDVPDVERLAMALIQGPTEKMFRVMRYLYGDQSEAWAYHINGWTPKMLQSVLTNFGYTITEEFRYNDPASLFPNCGVFIKARKNLDIPLTMLAGKAKDYFYNYLNAPRDNPHPAEMALYQKYCSKLDAKLAGDSQ